MSDWISKVTLFGFDIGCEKFMSFDLAFPPTYHNQGVLSGIRPILRPFCKVEWVEIKTPEPHLEIKAQFILPTNELGANIDGCPYCTHENEAFKNTFFDMNCASCVGRIGNSK